MSSFINAVQVGITLSFLLMCGLLLKVWLPSIKQSWRVYWSTGQLEADQKLMVGIGIAFAASAADNLYWGLAWGALQQEHMGLHVWMLDHGPFGNIFFRQIPGIVSVYFHLAAAKDMQRAGYDLGSTTAGYLFLGLLLSGMMLL